MSRVKSPKSTQSRDYTDRLVGLEAPAWKRLLNVQAPYRWNVRHLFGEREVLDVGCGIGRNLGHLAPRAIGVDHNPHSIEVCRARGLRAYTTVEFDQSVDATPGRFGGLLVAHVIEHMTPPEALELAQRYLKFLAPDGIAVFICPQEKSHATDASHVTFADFAVLSDLANRVGLRPTRTFSFPLPRPFGKVFAYNEFVLVSTKESPVTP